MFSCPLLSFYTIVKLVPVQPYLQPRKTLLIYRMFVFFMRDVCDRVMINDRALIRSECKMTVV